MIGALAILVIAVWFYRTAERHSLPPLAWCFGGVIVYYGGFTFWMYLVMRPLLGDAFRNHSLWLGLGLDISSVLVGVVCAMAFRVLVMLKRGTPPHGRTF
jgi:hypothetical protein